MVWGTAVWAVRDGPDGPRVSQTTYRQCSTHADQLFRLFATTVVSSTSETKPLLNGQGTSTATTFPSADLLRYPLDDLCHNFELFKFHFSSGILHTLGRSLQRPVIAFMVYLLIPLISSPAIQVFFPGAVLERRYHPYRADHLLIILATITLPMCLFIS